MVASKERGARGHLVTPPPPPPLPPLSPLQADKGAGGYGPCTAEGGVAPPPPPGWQPFYFLLNICRQPVSIGDVHVHVHWRRHVGVMAASRLPNSLALHPKCQLTTRARETSSARACKPPGVQAESFTRRQISRTPRSHRSAPPSA